MATKEFTPSTEQAPLEIITPLNLNHGTDIGKAAALHEISIGWVAPEYRDILAQTQRFEPNPQRRIERERSAHQVGFGKFTNTRGEPILNVALKPFSREEDAIHEALGAQRLRDIGVETYNPVGLFMPQGGKGAILATETRNDLMGLDRDVWLEGLRVANERDAIVAERNIRTVSDISHTLADMNAHGFFHPDGQVKNWGVTPTGRIGAFDTERHVWLGSNEVRGFSGPLALRDMSKLILSLTTTRKEGSIYGVGMYAGMGTDALVEAIDRDIVTPYHQGILDTYEANRGDRVLESRADELLTGVSTAKVADSIRNFKSAQ